MPVDPQIQVLLDKGTGVPATHTLSVDVARAQYEARIALMASPAEIASVREQTIDGPGGPLRIRIYTPTVQGYCMTGCRFVLEPESRTGVRSTLRWREPDSNHRSLRQVYTPTSRIFSDRLRCAPAGYDPVGPYWPRNVLERLIAEVFEGQVEFARGVFLDPRRNADSARFCQAFKTGGDVDAITKDVPVLDHHVAHVDADAELDAVIGRHAGVALCHPALHFDGAA